MDGLLIQHHLCLIRNWRANEKLSDDGEVIEVRKELDMICINCGGEYKETSGEILVTDDYIGDYTVTLNNYSKCSKCGDELYDLAACDTISTKRKKILDKKIRSYSLGQFISSLETADRLMITPQGLCGHGRIRHGFIFSTIFAGKRVYMKKSVEMFAKTGDGRFELLAEI